MVAARSPYVAFAANSGVAFATAELVTVALHEAGHACAAKAFGFHTKIHAFYETNPSGTPHQTLAILAAGPLASLVAGVALLACFALAPRRMRYVRLLLLWLGWTGVFECVNYAMVTPFLKAGDTARIADIAGVPTPVRYAVAVASSFVAFELARVAVRTMLALVPNEIPLATATDRRRALFRGFYLPLLAGTVLAALGGIGTAPPAVLLGLFGCAGNLDIVGFGMIVLRRPIAIGRNPGRPYVRLEPVGIALFVAVLAFYVASLSHGLSI